ncbi:Uncharacterised protein [Mycobacteroides abscessus subsp. abscessus]|nr:Uncharacterised protein [Mycobacteroides abscessus subsp. abscessus]
MGHIKYASDVGAPVEVAFTYTDNHLFVPDWMFGVSAFEPTGETEQGLGARYATTVRLAVWQTRLSCEITEYRRNAVLGDADPALRPTRVRQVGPDVGSGLLRTARPVRPDVRGLGGIRGATGTAAHRVAIAKGDRRIPRYRSCRPDCVGCLP